MRQMNDIGIGSLVIVCLISVFIGAVTVVQFAYQLGGTLVPRYYIGYVVRGYDHHRDGTDDHLLSSCR